MADITTQEVTAIFCKNVNKLKALGMEEEQAKTEVKKLMNKAIDRMTMKWTLVKVEKETEPNCWKCGTAIKWACWIRPVASEEGEVAVGVDCCEKLCSRSDFHQAAHTIQAMKHGDKLRRRIDEGILRTIENHGDEALTPASMSQVATWMNNLGADWQWIKANYIEYYKAHWPKEFGI